MGIAEHSRQDLGATALTALRGLAAGIVHSPEARDFLRLRDGLKQDQRNGQQHYLGFCRAPAARRMRAGSCKHLLEMLGALGAAQAAAERATVSFPINGFSRRSFCTICTSPIEPTRADELLARELVEG
jgi:hypothetical protein